MYLLVDLFGVCMQLYEIVLGILGIILFIAALVFTALKRDTKLLVVLFIISIVMIAFPAVTKLVFAEVTIEVQRLQCINDKLAQHPADSSLIKEAKEKIEDIKKAGVDTTNVKTVVTMARTNALLGDSVKAVEWADKGLKTNEDSKLLQQFKKDMLTPRVQVEVQLKKLETNPNDKQAEAVLQKQVNKLEQTPDKYTELFVTLSKAQLVLGDTAKAAAEIDSALERKPEHPKARELKDVYLKNRRVSRE